MAVTFLLAVGMARKYTALVPTVNTARLTCVWHGFIVRSVTPLPLLLVSDAASSSTGLGRITREIAIRANRHLQDVCRVATLGCGGPGSRKLNFQQYSIEGMGKDFIIPNLPEVWDDWAGNEPGVILFIWDASRLGWFSRDNRVLPASAYHLKEFLRTAKIKRWIYAPVDGDGPNGRLSYPMAQSLLGFDRVLAYGAWGAGVIEKSIGDEASASRDLWSVPHGIDNTVFFPRNRVNARINFFDHTGAATLRGTQGPAILEHEPLVGVVATNQTRKDWGLWAETAALFLTRQPKARFWIHTDELELYWSIPALLIDFGLTDRTVISLGVLEDEKMAEAYSACDLMLGVGPEGFGFPIFESLFCGTPCITGNYAGAPEHLWADLLVEPVAYRLEGLYAVRRPVYKAVDWVDKMGLMFGKRVNRPGELEWVNVWPQFEAWFRKGLAS